MPAYYKVDVVLNSQAVSVGLPSPQSVRVTIPLVGPQGPAGPQGEQGPPGEVSGTIVWDNVTEKPETFPPSTHTHVAADVTDFSTAAAAAAPVQSVAGRTGTVTLAVADVANAVADTDARLTDARTPTSHASTHATAGSDPLTPADIGAAADDDARLSDDRNPLSHAASHLPEGADELFDQSLNSDDSVTFEDIQVTGGLLNASNIGFEGDPKIDLEANTLIGSWAADSIQLDNGALSFTGTDAATNAATTRTNLGLGDSATADIGTTTGTVASGDHTHVMADITDLKNFGTLAFFHSNHNLAASGQTYYMAHPFDLAPTLNAALRLFRFPFPCAIVGGTLTINVGGTLGAGASGASEIRLLNASQNTRATLITNVEYTSQVQNYALTASNVIIDPTSIEDDFSLEIVSPVFSTAPTVVRRHLVLTLRAI